MEAAERYGLGYDLVAGANIAGFQKVADAMHPALRAFSKPNRFQNQKEELRTQLFFFALFIAYRTLITS